MCLLSHHEGFCAPLVEAMRAGAPVVARDVGAMAETLGDGGIVVPDGDPRLAAEALAAVLGDAALRAAPARRRRGGAGRGRARRRGAAAAQHPGRGARGAGRLMLAVLSIFVAGLALCLLAGIAVNGLSDPGGRWLGASTVPLGLCALVGVLYLTGAAMSGERAAPVVVAIVLLGIGGAVWRRRRATAGGPLALGDALRPTRQGAIVLGGSVLAGLAALLPTMNQGFPTTIGVSNNDGWGYATLVEWIMEHPVPRTVVPDVAHPLTLVPWSSLSNHFGIGFEHFASLLGSLLGREGFEVVNAAAAIAAVAAVGGWVMLAGDINPRMGDLPTGLVVAAVATPVLALPFGENYTTQFVALCLWPVALSAFLRFSRRPGVASLVVATLGVGSVVGVYPAVLPWLVLPLVAVAVLSPERPEWAGTRLRGLAGTGARARAARGAALLAVLVVGLMVVWPIAMWRSTQNLLFLDTVVAGGLTEFFTTGGYAAYAVGATSAFSLFTLAPLAWSAIAALTLMLGVYAAAVAPWRRPRGPELLLLAVVAGVVATTAAVVVRYRVMDELPYQVYKGLTSGAAILAGLVVLGLLTSTAIRGRTVRLLAIGLLIAVWVPVTSSVLQAQAEGGTGFRAADVEMGRALQDLPAGSVALVEGAAPDERSFQMRMMAAYFGTRGAGLTTIGLGSTGSYLTPGGGEEWRPAQPWTHVLRTRDQPVTTSRPAVWRNTVYTLTQAPELDLTPFGSAWYPSEADGTTIFAWTAGAAQLVLSNRSERPRRVRLEMTAMSYLRGRVLTVAAPRGEARQELAGDVFTPVSVNLVLPPRSATPVTLDARPGATTAPAGDGRQLLVRFQGLRLSER